MIHNGVRPKIVGWLVGMAVGLTWGSQVLRAAEQIEIITFAGSPLGVGQFTVRFAADKPGSLLPGQSLWLSDKQNRVLYPVYSTESSSLPTDLERTTIRAATAYFLFHGDGPLQVTLDGEQCHQGTSQPKVDPKSHAKLLAAWWQSYSSTNARVIEELRKRKVDVIPLPFDGPISTGGGLRCAHHPLLRESVLT